MNAPRFPFSAVVGHDDLKLALVLAAIDPGIGGVLLSGQKGSAKTTLARGLAALLPGDAPFAELPLGATEDRLVGTLDLARALTSGERRFEPGLLASAHGGVLYVDEVNLLADHLVDVLLDVAVSGINRIEREGVSHEHPSRFVLIGSMNPEEGDLRPQLLDRFGLAVEVVASTQPDERAEAVRRRLMFDADPEGFSATWMEREDVLRDQLRNARLARLPDDLLAAVSALCASVGAEGLRADLVLCRGAAALAGWEGRAEATANDVRRVAPFALAHRRRRSPFEDPGIAPDELDQALDNALDGDVPAPDVDGLRREVPQVRVDPSAVMRLEAARSKGEGTGRRSTVEGPRGRLVGDRRVDGTMGSVAVGATAQAAALRRAGDPHAAPLERSDLREAVREQRAGNLLVLAVDASGSMGAESRMEAVKGAVLGLLVDAYQRRDRVALITFSGEGAEVILRPTSSVEVARARLQSVVIGGRTPLAAGLAAALDLATAATAGGSDHRPLIVLVSDGRATAATDGGDPVEAAHHVADAIARRGFDAVVIDAETGPARLGLAAQLAESMGARCLTLAELTAGALERALRSL